VAVRKDVYSSDNVTGADNQQERLGSAESANWFLAGFIEGEGALCVSIKAHPTCRSGFYVDPGFFLYQHESGRRILELAQATFGSGRISRKSGSETVLTYEISSTRVLREQVVPFFERYVLPFSCKADTFSRFREILEAMERGEHRNPSGLARIVEKAYAMNPAGKGKRRARPLEDVLSRILRGHTSDIPASG
jgi:LAGLIDADG endonuclease